MFYLYLILSLNVFIISVVKRELLYKATSFIIILVANVLLFISSFLLANLQYGNDSYNLLKIPIISLCVFKVMAFFFKLIYKRYPKDSYGSWDWSLLPDGIFNLFFTVIGNLPILIFLK